MTQGEERRSEGKMRVQVDLYTKVCLTVIAVLLAVLILGLWGQAIPSVPQARAEDAGTFLENSRSQQLAAMIKEQQQTNSKLDEVIKTLTSGQVKVQLQDAAKTDREDRGQDAKKK